MPYQYREVQIEDDKSVVDAGTETIDLNVKHPITSLIIRFKVEQAAALDNQPAHTQVTKISIVDGGQVYYSLSGPQEFGASAYGLKRIPNCFIDGRAGNPQTISFQLMFGRYLGDEEFSFSPSKMLNPQLKVVWAKHASHTTNECKLGVTARIMEGAPIAPAALMWKEVEAWITAAEGDHKVDLPVDLPIRSMMLRMYQADGSLSEVLKHVKMDCDLGEFIPVDLDLAEFEDICKSVAGPFHVGQHGVWSDSDRIRSYLGRTMQACGTDIQGFAFCNFYTAGSWPYFIAYSRTHEGVESTDRLQEAMCTGFYPEMCMLYPFGHPDKPETWFPARTYGEIAVKLTEGAASRYGSLCVQQPRPIP